MFVILQEWFLLSILLDIILSVLLAGRQSYFRLNILKKNSTIIHVICGTQFGNYIAKRNFKFV